MKDKSTKKILRRSCHMNKKLTVVCSLLAACLGLFMALPMKAASLQLVTNNWGTNGVPSYISMYIYVPDNVVTNPPILVVCHYCGGNAAGIFGMASGSGIVAACNQYGFIMIFPQTSQNCWDVGSTNSLTRDSGGDTEAIAHMVNYTINTYQANRNRVYVTGASSGAMMTEALLALYPDVFKAGAEFAGVPAGCWAVNYAPSSEWSSPCAGGQVIYTPQQWGDIVRAMYQGYSGPRPRVQLWHGTADTTISYVNQTEAIKEWTDVLGLSTNPTVATTVTFGSHQWTRQIWQDSCSNTVIDAWSEQNGPHGTDADLNAQYVIPFLGLDKVGPLDPVVSCGTPIQVAIPATATEGEGLLAGQGSITINPAPTNGLVVNLTSSNTNKVTVPSSVVIPAGQSNAVSFDLTIVDDGLLNGDQNVAITATAIGYGTSQATILVYNTNTATLTVTLPATATKGAGTLVNAGHVSASSVVAANYSVDLVSSDASKLVVPSTVVIPTGQTSAVFNLTVLSDNRIDGPQVVTVTAHVPAWTDGSASMTILDNNPLPDHFVWSVVPSPQFVAQPFQVTITAQDINNYQVNYMLPVNLSAWAPGTAPATNTVLGPPVRPDSENDGAGSELTVGYSFTPSTNLVVTSFRHYFGDKVSLWTDNGVLLASQNVTSVPGTWVETPLTNSVVLFAGITYRIGVHENGVTYYFDDTLQTSFPNGTVNAYWAGYGDAFPIYPDIVTYYVDSRYGTNVVSIPVSPVVSGNFTNGLWAGNLAVLQLATSVTLQASVGGHSGQSVPFAVLNAPRLSITASGGSVVISWPVAPAGFSLEETPVLSAGSIIWTAAGSPSVVSGLNIITNTPSETSTFYRLIK
jgi:acetylxylan esterase